MAVDAADTVCGQLQTPLLVKPAVAVDAADTRRLPSQVVAEVEDQTIAQVSLAMVDDQTLPAKVGDPVRGAVAVGALFLPFGANRNGLEDRRTPTLRCAEMCLLQLCSQLI